MELTPYQRGNRDGLLALAAWADEQAKLYRLDYEKMSDNIGKNSLSGLRYDMLVNNNLARVEVYSTIASHARRMAEALPIDPET